MEKEKERRKERFIPEGVRDLKESDRLLLKKIMEREGLGLREAWAKYGALFENRDDIEDLKESFNVAKETFKEMPEDMEHSRGEIDRYGRDIFQELRDQIRGRRTGGKEPDINDLIKGKIAGVFDQKRRGNGGDSALASVLETLIEQQMGNQGDNKEMIEMMNNMMDRMESMMESKKPETGARYIETDDGKRINADKATLGALNALSRKMEQMTAKVGEEQESELTKTLDKLKDKIDQLGKGPMPQSMKDLQGWAERFGLELRRPSELGKTEKTLLKKFLKEKGQSASELDMDMLVNGLEAGILDEDILDLAGKNELSLSDQVNLINKVRDKLEDKKDMQAKKETRKTRIEGTVDLLRSLGTSAIKQLGTPVVEALLGGEKEMSKEEMREKLEEAGGAGGETKKELEEEAEKAIEAIEEEVEEPKEAKGSE